MYKSNTKKQEMQVIGLTKTKSIIPFVTPSELSPKRQQFVRPDPKAIPKSAFRTLINSVET
jgi:hypothetical protein